MTSPVNLTFRLYGNCVPVRGARRSVICDLQRSSLHFIPNALFEILTEKVSNTFADVCARHASADHETLNEYFEFLSERELGFWTSTPERYPIIDLTFDAPGIIDHVILDVSETSNHDYSLIVSQLTELSAEFLHVRSFVTATEMRLMTVLAALEGSRFRGVELTLKYSKEISHQYLLELCEQFPRISSILVHGSEELRTLTSPKGIPIRFSVRVIDGPQQCGFVHPRYFSVTLPMVSESQKFNSCLNRKVAIDAEGNTCNCSAMSGRYGSVTESNLKQTVASTQFQALWHLSKDDIAVCQDCEFRYICMDCRAHVMNSSDIKSKPQHCSYDPYTATWNELATSGDS